VYMYSLHTCIYMALFFLNHGSYVKWPKIKQRVSLSMYLLLLHCRCLNQWWRVMVSWWVFYFRQEFTMACRVQRVSSCSVKWVSETEMRPTPHPTITTTLLILPTSLCHNHTHYAYYPLCTHLCFTIHYFTIFYIIFKLIHKYFHRV